MFYRTNENTTPMPKKSQDMQRQNNHTRETVHERGKLREERRARGEGRREEKTKNPRKERTYTNNKKIFLFDM